ncbi:MAG: glycoside hydrolase family 2 protein [Clostridia bacterium]|nr:glycoside hydrolase family 2 protein [Clostridia bacterium]
MKRKFHAFFAITIVFQLLLGSVSEMSLAEETVYQEPSSPSVTYNMNVDWKFTKPSTAFPLASAAASVAKGGKQFYEVDYDDSAWETVSIPHAVNAEDSFDSLIGDAGEAGLYRGFMFYRKHFTVPASDAGKKIFIEFEAVRQSAYVYVNGTMVGYYEAGVTAFGFDITDYVKYGEDNLIAVASDNAATRGATFNTVETIPGNTPGDLSGASYQWNTKDFNEVQGGITGNVLLYAKSTVYQTLPLYNNLKTKGNYIYASDFNIREKTATINVEAEVRNETSADKNLTLEVNVVDSDGKLAYTFSKSATVKAATDKGAHFLTVVPSDAYASAPSATNADTVDVTTIKASYAAENLNFWSPDAPFLYTVYTVLKEGDTVLDVQKKVTGFRKVTYDATNGLLINDSSVFLTGYAQRATNEWAVVGVANDWLEDVDMQLVKESNANFIRWMHVAPKPNAIRSGDKYGVVSVVPAGDKEGDVSGRQWAQRVETMRDAIIYFRNSPSVIFWEAGNASISAEHMSEMTAMKNLLDPSGGRYIGCRSLSSTDQINAAEYVGTMLNRYASSAKTAMKSVGKMIPIMETEYHREEAPRRVWDDYSPPDYDYDNKWLGAGATKTDGYDIHDLTSEDFVVNDAASYQEFYNDRVGGASGNDYYSAVAALIWADSNQHGRNAGSENDRTSGRVDAVRIKKQSFYAYQVMQSATSKIHIVGHWNYPQVDNNINYKYALKAFNGTYWAKTGEYAYRDPTKKTVYVVGTTDCKRIDLLVNGVVVGTDSTPDNTFIYAFPNVDVTQSGKVQAIAYNARGEKIAEDEIKTAGNPYTLRLTAITGPDGLIADGSDVMYYDVEVVDKDGNVCPLSYDKITFELSGNGVFLGGYNSGKFGDNSVIRKNYVYAECGTNRVFIRSTRTAGQITLKATMEGMLPVTVSLNSVELPISGGLTTQLQRAYAQGEVVEPIVSTVPVLKPIAKLFTAIFGVNTKVVKKTDSKKYYTVTVNGTTVDFGSNKPYEQTGVFGPVIPVLDALKTAGADFSYSYDSDTKTLTVTTAEHTIKAVANDAVLYVDSDTNLMNSMPEIINDAFYMEINALVGYIPKVSASTDTTNYVYNITLTN